MKRRLKVKLMLVLEWAEENDIEYEIFAEEGTQSSRRLEPPKITRNVKEG